MSATRLKFELYLLALFNSICFLIPQQLDILIFGFHIIILANKKPCLSRKGLFKFLSYANRECVNSNKQNPCICELEHSKRPLLLHFVSNFDFERRIESFAQNTKKCDLLCNLRILSCLTALLTLSCLPTNQFPL